MARMLNMTILAVAMIFAADEPRQTCLEYEPAEVTVTGKPFRMVFPGPPEFSSIEEGDEALTYWILFLDEPVCLNSKPGSWDEDEANVYHMQLVLFFMEDMYKNYQHILSKRVIIKGQLYHAHTAWHKTKVLLKPMEIRLVK